VKESDQLKELQRYKERAGINDPGYNIAAHAFHSYECFGRSERMVAIIVVGIADAGRRSHQPPVTAAAFITL
jgi:hypothetical protein